MAVKMDLGDMGSGFEKGYKGIPLNPLRESTATTCGNVVGLIVKYVFQK